MKTAEEVIASHPLFFNACWTKESLKQIIKTIQLDAYKAGMTEAAVIAKQNEVPTTAARTLYPAYEAILTARDNKTSL